MVVQSLDCNHRASTSRPKYQFERRKRNVEANGLHSRRVENHFCSPVLAGLLVSVSDMSGPIGVVKEALAVVKAVTESAAGTSNELIKTLAEEIKARGGKPDMPELPAEREGVPAALIDTCKRAAAVVAQKSASEAEEYKRWLLALAPGRRPKPPRKVVSWALAARW
jgi:hypothetical protein